MVTHYQVNNLSLSLPCCSDGDSSSVMVHTVNLCCRDGSMDEGAAVKKPLGQAQELLL